MAESSYTDPDYLLREQYKDAGNLNARIALHRRFSVNAYGWSRWLFDQLLATHGEASTRRMLDLGCGPATLWRDNRPRLPPSWSLLLTDFSAGMVQEARGALGERALYALADSQALPFPPRRFDVVLANHMLYHVPDRARAIAEIARVLAPGGWLFASTVGDRHLAEIDDRLRRLGVSEDLWGRAASRGFTLENGPAQLAPSFDEVRLLRYEDTLRVTEVEPLIDYVMSMRASTELSPPAVDQLRADFADEIAARGFVSVFKDSGVLLARALRGSPDPRSSASSAQSAAA